MSTAHVNPKLLILSTNYSHNNTLWKLCSLGLMLNLASSWTSRLAKCMLGRGVVMTDALPVFYSKCYCSNLRQKQSSWTLFPVRYINILSSACVFFFTRDVSDLSGITYRAAGSSCGEQQAWKKAERTEQTSRLDYKHTHMHTQAQRGFFLSFHVSSVSYYLAHWLRSNAKW